MISIRLVMPLLAALAAALLFSSCEEADAVSLRLRVRPDLSGTLTTSSLVLPSEAHPLAGSSQGVQWGDRVGLVCASGDFTDLTGLDLDGITFASGVTDGVHFLRVILDRGPNAQWARKLVPADLGDEQQRRRLSRTLDPTGQAQDLGSLFKLEIELPSAVVGHGVNLRARRLKEEATKDTATLVVPLEFATSPGRDLVWHLTWES